MNVLLFGRAFGLLEIAVQVLLFNGEICFRHSNTIIRKYC